jgi:hypothetical protein
LNPQHCCELAQSLRYTVPVMREKQNKNNEGAG